MRKKKTLSNYYTNREDTLPPDYIPKEKEIPVLNILNYFNEVVRRKVSSSREDPIYKRMKLLREELECYPFVQFETCYLDKKSTTNQ